MKNGSEIKGNLLYNRMSACSAQETHRISNLPDLLIDLILDLLPIQDAVRTSILSKNWLHTWTTMPSLVFDDQFSEKFAKNGPSEFIRIINHVLLLHNGPILKFDLHIPDILPIDSFQQVDEWILMLSRKDLREFILINSNRPYRLPSFVFSCLQLRELQLQNCIMNPPPEFQGFPNLELLGLRRIDFEANPGGGTLINLPQLKKLSLGKCKNSHNFKIKANKLHTLVVVDCADVTPLTLFHSQCVTTVGMYSSKPKQGSAQVDKKILGWMSSNLPKLRYFYVNGYSLKFYIAECIPKWHPLALNGLKHLGLVNINFGDLVQFQAALCMLQNIPSLETFYVRNEQKGPGDICLDAEPTSYCSDQPLKRLQIVDITSVEGSKPELLFIKLLLGCSPELIRMSITLGTNIDALERDKFAKDVFMFPRASGKVELLIDTITMAVKYPQIP